MSSVEENETTILRQRFLQVFEYLKALNELRNPVVRQVTEHPWHLWLDTLPTFRTVELATLRELDAADDASSDSDSDWLLRVGRPKLKAAPEPSDELKPWIVAGWEKVEVVEVSWKTELETTPATSDKPEQFGDDPNRIILSQEWIKERNKWRVAELPARSAMSLFENLYELFAKIEREQDRVELVLGNGIASWWQELGGIYHPIVLRRVQLTFNSKVPEFRIVDVGTQVEVPVGLFSDTDVDPVRLAVRRREAEDADYHPLGADFDGFLKGFATTLDVHGEFIGKQRPAKETAAPQIGLSPVLFLRSRSVGFSTAIEKVIDRIRDDAIKSNSLEKIVGIDANPLTPEDTFQNAGQLDKREPSEPILFGKPSNPEQIRIAQRLDQHGSVLVQGPPGTGKSHTIANLIGHLVAQKKSVLVTSHTTKALRVLHNHIAKDLQPLAVSVLDSDLDSRKQLESAVEKISERLANDDPGDLEKVAEQRLKEFESLTKSLNHLKSKLLDARTSEYRDVVFAGVGITPSKAARKVGDGIGIDDWIPAPVALGAELPISTDELAELYGTNETVTIEDDAKVELPLPAPHEVAAPVEIEDLFSKIKEHGSAWDSSFMRFWGETQFKAAFIRPLERIVEELNSIVSEARRMTPWQWDIVRAYISNGEDREVWQHFVDKTEEAARHIATFKLQRLRISPDTGNHVSYLEQLKVSEQICEHLNAGKKLGILHKLTRRNWSKVSSNWRVKSGPPKSIEEFSAIRDEIRLKILSDELVVLWEGLLTPHGELPSSGLTVGIESACEQYKPLVEAAQRFWATKVVPLIEELAKLGFNWSLLLSEEPPRLTRNGEMLRTMDAIEHRLLPVIKATIGKLSSLVLNARIKNQLEMLQKFTRPETDDLISALNQRDERSYQMAHAQYLSAYTRWEKAKRRRELLSKLEREFPDGPRAASAWASAIRNRIAPHDKATLPGDPNLAWEWRQLNDELEARSRVSIEELTAEIEDKTSELHRVTIELIEKRAWAGQMRRTNTSQRQALVGWLDTIRRIGKGYGKRAATLRVEAGKLMSQCQSAVPVWIVPLSRLVQTFDFADTRFDVVIIDEASQCDVMGLLALAIANQVVVVGDHEQVSPLAVGQNIQAVHNLIRQHLSGIPNSQLYDGQMSIYDLARQSFPGSVRLLEHFRCVPEIISFSNHLSYNGEIKPLRDSSTSPLRPQVIEHRVAASGRTGKVNQDEALSVASLVIAASEYPLYENQTLGVVSMVGDEQAIFIQKLLLRHMAPEEIEKRRILCGNPAQFQGDERDVMFLSMVDVPGDGPLSMRADEKFKQRFNVAASRARNQMWVVHSLNPDIDLKPGDLRKQLIDHARDPRALDRAKEEATSHAESEFERLVIERLIQARYVVVPQWEVGKYRIDIVVKGKDDKKLAVECDGDRFHALDRLPDDMERQAVLERLGWKFHRIRGSEFFRSPDAAMARLFSKLQKIGIEPELEVVSSSENENDSAKKVIQSLRRRADELKAEWLADE